MELNLWIAFWPAEDVPGVWVSHCLDLDIVTQGEGFDGARAAIIEALAVVIEDDLESGREPLSGRERAPVECWERLWSALKNPHRVPLSSVPAERRNSLAFIAGQLSLRASAEEKSADGWGEEMIPEPWMIASRSSLIPNHC